MSVMLSHQRLSPPPPWSRSSAHLPRLPHRVRQQEGASPRCHGGHGPRRPQRWRLHPDRLHPPRQQRLPRFHLLLQDLPARRALWGERVCSQLIIKILFSGLARARSPPSYSLAGEKICVWWMPLTVFSGTGLHWIALHWGTLSWDNLPKTKRWQTNQIDIWVSVFYSISIWKQYTGCFFNCSHPKNSKYKKKNKVSELFPPKNF